MKPEKKPSSSSAAGRLEPPRRSSRIAANAVAEAKAMHDDAMRATKDWFNEMGKEMQRAEDAEAAEEFAAMVKERESATGMCCVMLESVEEESDDESDDEQEEEDEESEDDEDKDEDEDEDETDEDWAPDGMREKLARALKVFVPFPAAEALESAQLTMTVAEAVPGAGLAIADRLVHGAEDSGVGSDEQFAAALAATVTLWEADARTTWARDAEGARGIITRLAEVWRGLFHAAAAMNTPGKKKSKLSKTVSAGTGVGRLADDCKEALVKYLEKLSRGWGPGEEGEEQEEPLNLAFEFITSDQKGVTVSSTSNEVASPPPPENKQAGKRKQRS